ncbi:Magnesium transporter ALR1 [Grifola frondosa]|uniref:Magnesium transporter ALR1 n=1 Tax=Grifola frondosa TaxID=5627 RepID=A0A1C7MRA7_GRIFR|nr:Magnesium transporter ALR1 [Grifola frondosa]
MDVRFPPPAETFQLTPKDLDAISEGGADDNDIYRGQPPAPPRPSSPSALSSSSSSSSSSRSSGSVFRGRLGAIHAGVEHAIARWARAWVSSSSLPSSSVSSSSKPSIFTVTRSQLARRRRHQSSVASLHNARSEREIAARIRAREKSRYIPRGFVLYTPQPVIVSSTILQPEPEILPHAHPDHILRTNSLPNLITFLNAVLREGDKARRPRAVPAIPRPSRAATVIPLPHQDYMMPDLVDNEPKTAAPEVRRRGRKGKQRADTAPMSVSTVAMLKTPPSTPSSTSDTAPKAWWLDVSSPTWEDMCAIGKLLHLHPLTLEDILQQDPREKLELFPKLGYYFISFRAIESQKSRERLHPLPSGEEGMSKPTDEGIVGEVNVYLVVFRQGVCSFHFADVAEHVDRVRNKILLLGETVNMSSDWIAHGIMDSIVDSFFPFLEGIEKEVTEIENLVFSVQGSPVPATISR